MPLEGFAKHDLAEAGLTSVDIGDVEESHPGINCGVDNGIRAFLRLRGSVGAPQVVTTQPDS
ncbi:hypothetical protein StoSoilB5_17660 [Arthrobacter sp. StoSoilB5]|nr:hypothetical protein StoSoilB5_17660 [Arthrobacter sp. StoSoilB5]